MVAILSRVCLLRICHRALNDELQIDPMRRGVIVLQLDSKSPARRYQFVAPGDVIKVVNGNGVDRVVDLASALENPSEQYVYQIERRGRTQECIIIPNRSFPL